MNSDDLAWATVTPKKCRHPRYAVVRLADAFAFNERYCERCHTVLDAEASRRGLNNRKRGNAIELWVCRLLGIERRGQYGGLNDGGSADDFLVVQVKSGGAHQAALLAKIRTIPSKAEQLRGWVTVSTPGAGHQREGVISFDLREFAAWYGRGIGEDEAA